MDIKTAVTSSMFFSKLTASIMKNRFYRAKQEEHDKILDAFVPAELRNDKKYIRRLKKDWALAKVRHTASLEEYFRYGFEKLSDAGRHEYLTVANSDSTFRKVEPAGIRELFTNKYLAYQRFSKYYKREVLPITEEKDFAAFCDFVSRHSEYIAKPLTDSGGHGVHKERADEGSNTERFDKLLTEKGSIVEELIIQDEGMAKYHPQSINTVRMVTYCKDHKITIIQASTRIGTGDSVVDNGCLSAGIDYTTGTIITKARMAHVPGLYVFHPDTGCQILGSRIPHWEELQALVNELPYVIEEQPIVGWDLALSKDGWVLIEANSRPMVQILSGDGIGMRKPVESALGLTVK